MTLSLFFYIRACVDNFSQCGDSDSDRFGLWHESNSWLALKELEVILDMTLMAKIHIQA